MSSSWGNQPRYGEFEIVGAGENKPRLLGEGSFGKTFEAVRTDTIAGGVIKESVALKVLKPDLLASEPKRFQFIQELVALTKLKHSNLIHYIRCGEEHGEVYYAMELCRGGDLTKLVNAYGALHEKVAALIGLQVATGLREVHQRHHLIHRDIKPSNIMLVDELEAGLVPQHLAARFEEQDSLCRIVDFGLVDFALNAQDEENRASRQRFAGSPMYASPEQVFERPVDGRSDIYSLGMTLWFLVQGKGPLLDAQGRELRDHKEAMRRHIKLDQEHEGDFPTHLSDGFRRVLAKMVAKKPESRYANAGEVLKALREYLSEAANVQEPTFSITRTASLLDQDYKLENVFPSCMGRKSYVAQHLGDGHKVKLTVVKDFDGGDRPQDAEAMAQHLSGLAEVSLQPSLPGALLRVQEVIFSSDVLAYVEDLPEQVPLAEVLRVRAGQRRSIPFAEAVVVLRPIAEALDFLMQHQRNKIYLASEEVWVNCEQIGAGDPNALIRPLTEWRSFAVHFSMMWLPSTPGGQETGAAASWTPGTISNSMQLSDSVCDPMRAFCRLIYRILNGSEVAAAAEIMPTAYVQTVALGAASNNLVRDILCEQQSRPNAGAVLTELCAHEGVMLRSLSPTSTIMTPGNSAFASAIKTKATEERVGELVAPGMVRSPYGAKRRMAVPSGQWHPGQILRCTQTGKNFRLPATLMPLVGANIQPGSIESPYVTGHRFELTTEQWQAGGMVECPVTHRPIQLPEDLPEILEGPPEIPELEVPIEPAASVSIAQELPPPVEVQDPTTPPPRVTVEQILGERYRINERLPALAPTHQRYALESLDATGKRLVLSFRDYSSPVSAAAIAQQEQLMQALAQPPLPQLCRALGWQMGSEYQYVLSENPGELSLRELLQQRGVLEPEEAQTVLHSLAEACEAAVQKGWPQLNLDSAYLFSDQQLKLLRIPLPDVPSFDTASDPEAVDPFQTMQVKAADRQQSLELPPKDSHGYVRPLAILCGELLGQPHLTASQNALLRQALASDSDVINAGAAAFVEKFFRAEKKAPVRTHTERLNSPSPPLTPTETFDAPTIAVPPPLRPPPPPEPAYPTVTTVVAPLRVSAEDRAEAEKLPPATRLRLTPDHESDPMLCLCAEAPLIFGRSASDADFVAQFRPRSGLNDSRSRRISRAHARARLDGGRILFEEKDPINPTVRPDGSLHDGTPLSSPAHLLFAGEYPLELHCLPSDYKAAREVRDLSAWNDTLPPRGALVARPAGPGVLLWETALVLSDVDLHFSPSGRPWFDVDRDQPPTLRVHHLAGQFWIEVLSEPLVRISSHPGMAHRHDLLLLRDGLKLLLGTRSYSVRAVKLNEPQAAPEN